MADAALFVGWNRPVPGREKEAGALWEETMAYYKKLQDGGRIESFEPVILAAHGGDLNGFFLLRGEASKVDELHADDEFVTWLVKAGLILDGFGVIRAYIGEGLDGIMTKWMSLSKA
jgi:hypothetical protein